MTDISILPEERGAQRFIGRGALLFVLIVGLLPNLFFLVVMPFFIAERLITPLLYVTAAIAALFLPRFAVYALFFIIAVIDLCLIVMVAFHLPLALAIDSVRYMATIDVSASSFYVAVISINLAFALVSAWLFDRNRTEIQLASPLPVLLVALSLMAADFHFNFHYFPKSTSVFDSADSQNGLSTDAVAARGGKLLIVMVEELGAFADPAEKKILSSKLEKAASHAGYAFSSGTTPYSGSTTGAASRELCGRWGDHRDYIAGAHTDNCLPKLLRERGYETVAYHGYTSDMFERHTWYPNIGFSEFHSMETMVRDAPMLAARRCGSVFLGLCDSDVGALVHSRLLEPGDKPKFVYWLTLNSHVPFVAKDRGALGCRTGTSPITNATVCELTELWGDVFDAIAVIAADTRLPPTDILVVGDHHTPLWERAAKDRFTLGLVDWYMLRKAS